MAAGTGEGDEGVGSPRGVTLVRRLHAACARFVGTGVARTNRKLFSNKLLE